MSETGLFAPISSGMFNELRADVWLAGGSEGEKTMEMLERTGFTEREAGNLVLFAMQIEPEEGIPYETQSSFIRKLAQANADDSDTEYDHELITDIFRRIGDVEVDYIQEDDRIAS